MPSDEEEEQELDERDVELLKLRRLYNNLRQREWVARNREHSRELKNASYHRNKPPLKRPKWHEVALEELRKKEEAAAAKAKADKYPPDNEECEGECDIHSCWNCGNFYHWQSVTEPLEEHPWFAKMGLPQPKKWPRTIRVEEAWWHELYAEYRAWRAWREENYVTEEAWDGTEDWTVNRVRMHPALCLLRDAYDFVCLPEPAGVASGPAAAAQMPSIAEVMELAAAPGCRVRPVCGGRRWVSACNGPWNYSIHGSCKRCSVVCPKSKTREQVQAAAELGLHGALQAEWKRWLQSWPCHRVKAPKASMMGWLVLSDDVPAEFAQEGFDGAAWRRQWRLGVQERVEKRGAATAIAARVARRSARARYAGALAACESV